MTVNEVVRAIRRRWVGQAQAGVERGEPVPRVRAGRGVPVPPSGLPVPPPVPRMSGGILVSMVPEPPFMLTGDAFDPPHSADAFWYLPAAGIYARGQVGRHTQVGLRHRGSLRQWGNQDVASGPEGTIVLYPPRLPRAMAGPRAVGNNAMQRVIRAVPQTPGITVVQATQPQGGWP
ncbi:MAG: hypothetical protein KGK07_13520 [Chloroflexota bacterium]|nr:hypothetical protein [Chloroflexota bacterium]